MATFTQGGEWPINLDFFSFTANLFLRNLPVVKIPRGVELISFLEIHLLNLGKTATKLGFQNNFDICGVFGFNLMPFRHMNRYLGLWIKKALGIIFPKHFLDD